MGRGTQHIYSDIHKKNQERLEFSSSWIFMYFFTNIQMNNFTIDMAAKSQTLNSSSKLRISRQNMMLNFMEIKSNESKLTQKEISKQLGFADSTSERYRDDINMESP